MPFQAQRSPTSTLLESYIMEEWGQGRTSLAEMGHVFCSPQITGTQFNKTICQESQDTEGKGAVPTDGMWCVVKKAPERR